MSLSNFNEVLSMKRENDSELSDRRRSERLQLISTKIADNPKLSFPEIFKNIADREGFYRFVRNEHIDPTSISDCHTKRTKERCEEFEEILVIHDTTQFKFPRHDYDREHLYAWGKKTQGFWGHFSLACSADASRAPLGVVHWRGAVPHKADEPTREFWADTFGPLDHMPDRWWDGVLAAERALDGASECIHLVDREGDCFDFLQQLVENNLRFVIRAGQNRRATKRDSEEVQLIKTPATGR